MSNNEEMIPEETPPLASGVGVPVQKNVILDEDFETEVVPVTAEETSSDPVDDEVQEPVTSEKPDTEETATEEEAEPPVEEKQYDVDPGTLSLDINRPIYVRIDPNEKGIAALSILPTTQEDLMAFKESADNASGEDINWLIATQAASNASFPGSGMIEAAIRRGAKWKGVLSNTEEGNHTPLCDHRTAYKIFEQPGTKISGQEAIEMFIAGTSLGRPVTIPLWRSGFWVKLRAPSAAYLADIDRAIAFSREEVGLEIFGAIGANDRLIFDEILIDAALKLVTETNIPIANNPLELKEYLSFFDIDTLIWGMAEAAFPDGVEIAIPCPSCRHVSHVKANLLRMRFVDESRLTAKQIRLMSKGISYKLSAAELKSYQEEFEILDTQTWEWNKRTFSFKSPTVEQYLTIGREYITAVGRSLTEILRDEINDDYHRGQAMKSILNTEETCRFTHFIREVKVPNSNQKGSADNYGVINNPSDILQVMRTVSGDYEASNDLIVAINDYINDAATSLIGFPNVPCPSCKKFYLSKTGAETIIVPFNPAVGFFILAQHKIAEAGSEPLTNLTMLGLTGLLSRVSAAAVQG